MADKQTGTANQTGIPDSRINWIKNPLITQIRFVDGAVYSDSVKIRYRLSFTNPTSKEVRRTSRPTPDDPKIRLFSESKDIPPVNPKAAGIVPNAIIAPPKDEEIKLYRSTLQPHERWDAVMPGVFTIDNRRLLTGTHIYGIVYWHNQLDWIDVREVLTRTDAQGRGRMRYPITDNAPSNRLYFKIYKPTEAEAAKGHKIEFLGEVDARTQVPPFPRARPGDFSPRTGYWQAVGESINMLGGYHEVFVKEGDSMPNLPGDVGVDPFSFEWRYVGEQPRKAGG